MIPSFWPLITRAPLNTAVMGGRVGTARATRTQLDVLLGLPSYRYSADEGDGKVTIGWVFKTPRGPAEIRDYWWNGPTEWSIAAPNHKAGLWLAAYLRRLGLAASTRTPR
jgi:hypothetical protein